MPAAAPRVRLYGAACLRRRAAAAVADDPATGALLDAMWAVLRQGGGVGLAAPQVGRELRLVVVRNPRLPAERQRLDLVNPVVVETFGPAEPFEEGCLSFPGLYVPVVRPRGVAVRYETAAGETRTLRDEGLVARIVQHEIDHLDGVLFIDRLGRARRWSLLPRLLWLRLRGLGGRGGTT
ncbi:MAG: peptide deformylase [Krumholzibacteria bacterium]|nr:peptide deformylase [Candidatus Krumholzibacteria bacterium]